MMHAHERYSQSSQSRSQQKLYIITYLVSSKKVADALSSLGALPHVTSDPFSSAEGKDGSCRKGLDGQSGHCSGSPLESLTSAALPANPRSMVRLAELGLKAR
jgi:hypothetical protein